MQNYKTIFLRTRANYLLLKITIQSIYYIYFTPQNKNQTPKTYYTKQKIVVIHLPKQIHHLLQHNIIQLTLHYIQKIHNIYILLFMLKHPSTYEQNFHNKLINQSVYFFLMTVITYLKQTVAQNILNNFFVTITIYLKQTVHLQFAKNQSLQEFLQLLISCSKKKKISQQISLQLFIIFKICQR
eukprot:TRINITY_DN3333_c0_g1_i3.p2 TRINITY_DN3333_c0_g1~~TRINITY_DN3333_c0_g1_i3.p2  ORF type:complete len:195 (+),score=-22.61 TRINITY_DN3333_c0_g1_i3:35-586(+)